jgi:hypothetical protein
MLIVLKYYLNTRQDSYCTLHFDNYARYNIIFSCNKAYTSLIYYRWTFPKANLHKLVFWLCNTDCETASFLPIQ